MLYRVGAIAAIVALAGTLIDIVLTMLPSWEVSTVPVGIEQWFVQFQRNPLLGLRNLDLLNVIIAVVSIPLYVAARRRTPCVSAKGTQHWRWLYSSLGQRSLS